MAKNIKKQINGELFSLCNGYIRCKTFYDWRKRYEGQRIDSKNTRIKKQSENSIIHLQMVCMDCWEKMVREKQH